jgi:hypothetical protein
MYFTGGWGYIAQGIEGCGLDAVFSKTMAIGRILV